MWEDAFKRNLVAVRKLGDLPNVLVTPDTRLNRIGHTWRRRGGRRVDGFGIVGMPKHAKHTAAPVAR
jgi:hypothetical protein